MKKPIRDGLVLFCQAMEYLEESCAVRARQMREDAKKAAEHDKKRQEEEIGLDDEDDDDD